jgi:hypothetical protein
VRPLALLLVAGCGSAARTAPPAPPVPVAPIVTPVVTMSCADAAIGIERVTKDLRAPDHDLLGPVRARCIEDAWSRTAIECFAAMRDAELAACVRHLPEDQRAPLLAEITGAAKTDGELDELVAKLSALQVGIGSCDQFVVTVANLMRCDAMPLEQRVNLGTETAEFWALPTERLTFDARARIAQACGVSLGALRQQAADAGCMP